MKTKSFQNFILSIIYISIFYIFYSINFVYALDYNYLFFSYIHKFVNTHFLYSYSDKESFLYILKKLKKEDKINLSNYINNYISLYSFLEKLNVSQDIYNKILKYYIESLKDPYSQFLSPQEAKNVRQTLFSSSFYGIGIGLTIKGRNLVVNSVLKGSSAEREGVKVGDILLFINNKKVENISDATYKLFLKKGESVKLTLKRKDKLITKILTSSLIEIKDISYKFYKKKKILYIKISLFTNNLSNKFFNILQNYQLKARYLVIDLRDCPGGVMKESIKIADLLLKKDLVITYIISKYNKTKVVSQLDPIDFKKIYILQNQATGSSAEILTGALKFNKAAICIGLKTMGKGRIQSIYNLKNSYMLILTTNAFLTPSGKDIHHKGILPDIKTLHALQVVFDLVK